MKAAILGSKNFDSLEFHLNDSLTFLGHEIFHIDIKDIVNIPYRFNYWGIKLITSYDEYIFKKIAYKIIEQSPELVVCTYRFIHPICIKLIKKALPSVPIIHVNPDTLTTFEYQQIFASSYDAYFSKDPFIVDFMKNKMNLNTFYLPEAFNPRIHKKPILSKKEQEVKIDIDVVAFGTMYPYRANMLNELVKSGIKVRLFGTQDRRFPKEELKEYFSNEFITGSRKADILYGAKVVFNNFLYAEIESANVKFFEINGIGGFQICDYKPTLKEYTSIPIEKFTYKSIQEAINLINYYLNNPEERYDLAIKQYDYFQKNHTYEHRINQILKTIFN